MTERITPIATAPPYWLALPPDELAELHRQMVQAHADSLLAIAEMQRALEACRQFPLCETAGDACRMQTLLSTQPFCA